MAELDTEHVRMLDAGFVTTKNDELEASCTDYTKRRQEAMDHGQKLTLEEIHELPVAKEVQLPSIAYWITLSPDEVTLAVAYGDSVALFEVAHIVEAVRLHIFAASPFHTFHKLQAQEIAWCRDPSSERLAVLTLEKQVVVCTLEGARDAISTETDASSIAWSPSGEQIAVGLVDATIAIYARDSLQFVRSIAQPESCAEQQFETHHVNWAENDLILAGYHKYDEENEETSALACIFDNEECVELDEVVGFFDVEGRRHQYFSRFLPDWRMFFIACSLSADIELLVSDPESGEWQLWKPLEKYQARLPMNADDEESFPMGFAINLNSTTPVPVDEDAFPPVPIISSTNTEGLLVNFAFVDTTVNEVDFVKSPSPFDKKATRAVAETSSETPEIKAEEPVSPKKKVSHEYGQNDENEFAESDGESSDEEEERKEEQDKARTTFRTMASDGADYIASEQFPKLFKAMGSTYDEEEHASTVEHLEKDGKIYENDFVSWYVNWIFGDDDSDSDEDEAAPASSESKPAEMKSKEEIAAVFSKFTAKEGSWKCAVCMVSNGPDAMKCSACETANPAAPKVVAPVTAASATSAGSIGSGGFSFPVPTGGDSKPSSFSFGVAPAAGSDAGGASKSTGFSFGGASSATGFSFPSSTTSSGTGFTFPSSTKPAADSNVGEAAASTAPVATAGGSAYPPDTTSKPKPPTFGAASGSGYPPDTTSKPKPPAFGAASSGGYPPDTTSKPKPPAFGAAGSGGYPPDTTSKPKPPAFGAASSGGYPPDTISKPKPPAFGAAGSGGHPPDTTSKPKPPAFGAAGSGGYPPDTTSKPKPPAFGAAGSGGYPPDTTSKPKPPAFGAAGSGGYPPDTTSKPKPPAFGAASSGGYPPDTTSKPKPPAFGAAGSGGYPPDTTSKPKPPMFGQSTTSGTAASSSSFGFGSFGKSLFGSKPELSASTDSSAQTNTSASTVTPTKPKSLFGSSGATGKAPDTSSSPFGVVPKANSKSAFSFGSASASDSKEVAAKISSARPSFSFDSVSSTLDTTQDRVISEDQPPTKRTLKFGDTRAFDAKTSTAPSTTAKAKPIAAPAKVSKDFPSSRMEGQLWKLIVDFDKSLQRVNESSKNISSKDAEFSKKLLSQMDKLRAQISSLCDEINNLDESRDQVEKDVLFVIGSDGDVHEQLEYGREILDSFNDEGLKRTLEEQPLDQRSKETWDSLKNKLSEVEKCCVELDSHLSSSKIGADASGAVSSAHLFRVLKQTYDNSKMQYNKACKLAEHLEKLSLRGDHMRRTNGVSRISGEAEAHPTATKAEMVQMIVETEERSQDVRRNFLSLCNNVVTLVMSSRRRDESWHLPRHPVPQIRHFGRPASKTERGCRQGPQRPSLGAPATETKPTTTTAAKPNVFSFPKPKDTTSAFGAAAKEEDKKTTSTASSFGGFGVNSPAVKRKAVDEPAPAFSLGGKEAPASSAVNFGSKDTSPAQPPSTASATNYKALLEEFYKVHNPSKTGSVLEKALSTYKGREEDLFTRLFTMYVPDSTPEDVKKYLSGGPVPPKSESVASASKASAPASTAAKSPFGGFGASTTTPNSAAKPSPFGASPSAFSLGPAANTSSGFGGFGSTATNSTTTTTAPSPFGQPAVDYRQKLVEFYQKHNPNKLSSVDATLQKYKGNEEKLFQNLATKYKVNASPAVQPANPTATASPFGKPGAFSASSTSAGTTFGSASSVGFGAAKPAPSASPFGAAAAPASSPFGATSQPSAGFGSVSGSGFGGFQSTTATTPAFGAPSPFGATGGVNYREKLAAFYQQHNPAKLSSVDATLEKYKGREDHLFAMLEQNTTAFGGASGFGAPSALGAASAAPAFGSASNLGGAAQPAFGGAAGSGFGMASRMGGGGFGSAAPAASSGAATGTGFSAFGSQTPSFGGAPQQSGGFGAAANSGGFGSGFGGATTGGFGQPAAFSSSSFTQMR
ncbi:WD40/YVTN repeat-like-containing domain [Phytophthora cactorum]|nr:WD40/YVTN repeat-like-containing domain [Phytophthora cactorum]